MHRALVINLPFDAVQQKPAAFDRLTPLRLMACCAVGAVLWVILILAGWKAGELIGIL